VTVLLYATARNDLKENQILYATSLVFGLITCAFHLSQAYALTYDTNFMDELRRLCPSRHPVLKSTISEEMAVKQAMARKLSHMIKHALDINKTKDLDSLLNKHYGQSLKHYESAGKKTQTAGGFFWCWRQLFGNQLFKRDGIWIPARMISGNLTQYVVAIYLLVGGLFLTARVADEYDVEWAKQSLNELLVRAFHEDRFRTNAVNSAVMNVTLQLTSYLSILQNYGAIDCGEGTESADDLLNKYCPGTGNLTECTFPPDANFLCPLTESSTAGSLNASSQLALLDASGFDGNALREAMLVVAQQSVESSVDSLFPS
jgi:hypothetical protein